MWRHSFMTTMLAVSLTACTSLGAQQASDSLRPVYPPAAFSHRVGTMQVLLYWNCLRPEPGVLRLEGVIQSAYASEVRYPEFDLVGLDANERVVSEAEGATQDLVIRTNQISPFQLNLRTVGSEVRFDLFYQYQSRENRRSLLAGTPVVGARLIAPAGTRFLVRDVCSETQHRFPTTTR